MLRVRPGLRCQARPGSLAKWHNFCTQREARLLKAGSGRPSLPERLYRDDDRHSIGKAVGRRCTRFRVSGGSLVVMSTRFWSVLRRLGAAGVLGLALVS